MDREEYYVVPKSNIENYASERAEVVKLLTRFLDKLDSDWWAEADQMAETTPYEIEIPVGLIWDINEMKKRLENDL